MSRFFNQNLVLKLISVAAAVVMWFYVSAERTPSIPKTKVVMADVRGVGAKPVDLIVRFRQDTVPVTITGPQSDVDQVMDGQIKAEFPLDNVHLGAIQLRGRPYQVPGPNINVVGPNRPVVGVEVIPIVQKSMRIEPVIIGGHGTLGPVAPHVAPDAAIARGPREDLQRVAKLVVNVEPSGERFSADVPVQPVDADGIEVAGVEVAPSTTHVDVTPPEAPASRSLVVNVSLRGQVAYPYQVTDVLVQPDQVIAVGKADALRQLSNISTEDVEVGGLMSDLTRDVALQLPPGVTLKNGRRDVHVTVRVHDTTRTGTAGT